ncbi:cytochrome c oxidase subunit II [Azospirillum doebereinerae]
MLRRVLPLGMLPALAGCAGDLSALDPAGPFAESVARLWWAMLLGAIPLFALVVGLFLLTVLRPGFGRRLSPKGWIVAGGLALPLPVLTALLGYALFQGEYRLGRPGSEALRVEARARMGQWSFAYPEAPGAPVTVGVLHLPAGRLVEVVVTSEDVIHSFWVPRLGGKIDAVPGHETRLRLLAEAPGTFGGTCAEYCGVSHTDMRFTVRAHEAGRYAAELAKAEAGAE